MSSSNPGRTAARKTVGQHAATAVGASAITALITAASSGGIHFDGASMEEFGKVVATWGLPGAITMFVFWYGIQYMKRVSDQAAERELRMATRMDKIEDSYRNELVNLIRGTNDALTHNTTAFNELKEYVHRNQAMVLKNEEAVAALLNRVVDRLGTTG